MGDLERLQERFDQVLWRWAYAAAGVKSTALEASVPDPFAPITSSVAAASELPQT